MSLERWKSSLAASFLVVASVITWSVIGGGVAGASAPSCTKTFNGSVDNTWSNASNWTPSGVPGSTDVACMSGFTVTISSASASVGAVEGGVVVADNSLTLNDASTPSQLDGLTLDATFTGPSTSTLTVDGNMVWGVGSNPFSVDSGGMAIDQPSGYSFKVEGSGQVYDLGGSVVTGSPVTIDDSDFIAANNPTITTTSTATFDPQTYQGNGGGGVLIKAAGVIMTGTTSLPDYLLDVTGTSSSLSGTSATFSALAFSVDTGGVVSVPSGDTLEGSSGTSTISGTLEGAGAFTPDGNLDVYGTLEQVALSLPNYTTTVEAASTFTPGSLTVSGATLNFDANGSTGALSVSSGTLTSSIANATLNVSGVFNWGSAGEISANGGDWLTISQGAGTQFNITGNGQDYLIGDTITTASPISITNPGFITTSNSVGRAVVTTTSTISFGPGVLISANGSDSATFSAAGLASHSDTALYGFQADDLTLTGGSSAIAAGTTLETGKFSLTGGSLAVDGTLNTQGNGAKVTGGTLLGSGTVDGPLTQSGGVVSPGDTAAIGTLSVSGDFDQSGGSLGITIKSASSYDVLDVTGSATVDATIAATLGTYSPVIGTQFPIVTGASTVTSAPTTITPTGHFVATALAHSLVLTAEVAPGAPTVPAATPGTSQATITWSPPTSTGGGPITSYTVTAIDLTTSGNGGQACVYTVPDTPVNKCVVTGLTNGDTYKFSITATNAAGTSSAATTGSVVPAINPGSPTDVVATPGNTQAALTWTPPAFDGGSKVTTYTVTATDETNSANGGQTCTYLVGAKPVNTCTVLGLTNGDLYVFKVTATNVIGPSSPSNPSNAVTPTNATVVVAPSRLVVDTQRTTTVTCSLTFGTMTACTVTVRAPNGAVVAAGSASNPSGSSSLAVTVTVNGTGLTLAEPVGGVTGRVTGVMSLSAGGTTSATASLKLERASQKITLAGSVLFASGSSKLSAAAIKILRTLGQSVTGARLAECDGYTDNVGSPQSNLALGLARAKAVCGVLKPYVKSIRVVSYGQGDPVATNATPAGRAKNRRVVIKVSN